MSRPANVQWPHRPETLALAELSYSAKFYGMEEVQQPRGAEPVAEAVKTVKVRKQMRKASGQKSSPRVEVVISLNGLTIQDRKTKQADEILQTLGQAFDMNYRKHLENADKQSELQGQLVALQQRIAVLEQENSRLKGRAVELEAGLERCTCGAASSGASRQAAMPAVAGLYQPSVKVAASAAVACSASVLTDFTNTSSATGARAAVASAQRDASVDLFGMESFQPPIGSTNDVAQHHQSASHSNPWLGDTAQIAFGVAGQPRWS